MDNDEQLSCPSCGMAMDSGRLILGSRVGLFNFLFGGFKIGTDVKLTWQDGNGNKSKAITGKKVKIGGTSV